MSEENNMFLTEGEIVDNILTQMKMISPSGESDLAYLKVISRDEMGAHHHGFGTHIRNEYKLWNPDNPLTQEWTKDRENGGQRYIVDGVDDHPKHPDAVSMNILHRLWDRINEEK